MPKRQKERATSEPPASAGQNFEMVRSRQADLALLMNPARMQQVRDIAFAGELLPQKSTDFYPKLLSGLTIYALE